MLWTAVLSAKGCLAFIVAPQIGAASERFGRKPPLLVQAILPVVPIAVLGFVPSRTLGRVHVALVFQVLSGLSGSVFGIPFAYLADLAAIDRRRSASSMRTLFLGLAFAPSMLFGPLICNLIADVSSTIVLYRFVVIMAIVNAVYIALLLPETVTLRAMKQVSIDSMTGVDSRPAVSRNPFRYFRTLSFRSGVMRPQEVSLIRRLCGIMFFLYIAKWSVLVIVPLQAQAQLKWTPQESNILMTYWGVSQTVTMLSLTLMPSVRAWMGLSRGSERINCWIGIIAAFAGLVIFAIGFSVDRPSLLYLGMMVAAVSLSTYTGLLAMAAKVSGPSISAEVLCLISSVLDVTEIIGPPVLGALFRFCDMYAKLWSCPLDLLPWCLNIVFVIISAAILSRTSNSAETERPLEESRQ